ncbi:MAG: hypothetical protein RPU39_13770 [Candidatus Sedimenticola sp. (ex Thyasira tokunagai)]
MTLPIIMQEFSEEVPPDYATLNANFRVLVATINSLVGATVIQFGAPNGDQTFVPAAGGRFAGQVSAPSILVGPEEGPLKPVITKAAAVPLLNQTISDPPTAAECQALTDKVDYLLGVLKSGEVIE